MAERHRKVTLNMYVEWLTRNSLSLQPQHSLSHKETLTGNQHRLIHTHTVAQRGIALTLAHTDPLAQPELLRNQRFQGEWLWSLPASVKLPLGNLRPASPMSGLYPCMHTSKEKVGITDYTSPLHLLTTFVSVCTH